MKLRGYLSIIFGCLLLATARCGNSGPTKADGHEVSLRIGVARVGSSSAITGLRPIVQNLTEEGLVRIGDDGRVEPRLAEKVERTGDGLTVRLHLRPGIRFHDGSLASAPVMVGVLQTTLPQVMGPAFADVDRIAAHGDNTIEIKLKRASLMLEETLEMPIRKPNSPSISTGPFSLANPDSVEELRANANYYLGRPAVDRIVLTNYPTVRAAWADMLRSRVDMLYEVGGDALEFMQDARNVSVFSFTRPYQYVVFLNVRSPKLRSATLRRALNLAIDRNALVRDAFEGHGAPSVGPISPRHWALANGLPEFAFDPARAAKLLASGASSQGVAGGGTLHFTCLVPPDYERVALVVKRQLESIGVVMDLQETSSDGAARAIGTQAFEAVIADVISGPSLFRTYGIWHSDNPRHFSALGSPAMDATLDRIMHAGSEDAYRQAVGAFQEFVVNDPPAIYLAWGERARAVSRRFNVPAEPGRDVLTTLRLWKPSGDERLASRN